MGKVCQDSAEMTLNTALVLQSGGDASSLTAEINFIYEGRGDCRLRDSATDVCDTLGERPPYKSC